MKTLNQTLTTSLLGLTLAVSLVACREQPIAPKAAACSNCGTITNVEQRKAKGEGTGVGAVIGAVAGAVVGHQIGDGRGKDAATVAGAVGGGFAGNEIEKRVKGTIYYQVTVAMEAGGTRTLDVDSLNGLANGSRVKVVGNSLQAAGG